MNFPTRSFSWLYRRTCALFLGRGEYPEPPLALAGVWAVVTLLRLYPAGMSLWEDEIWMLVVSVNQAWTTVLGFSHYYSGNHIAYSAIGKLLLAASHYHCTEFMFRLQHCKKPK